MATVGRTAGADLRDGALLALCQIRRVHRHWIHTVAVGYSSALRSLVRLSPVRMNEFSFVTSFICALASTRILQVTDERVKIMSEIIKSMRIVKMYCWESAFVRIVQSVRK